MNVLLIVFVLAAEHETTDVDLKYSDPAGYDLCTIDPPEIVV